MFLPLPHQTGPTKTFSDMISDHFMMFFGCLFKFSHQFSFIEMIMRWNTDDWPLGVGGKWRWWCSYSGWWGFIFVHLQEVSAFFDYMSQSDFHLKHRLVDVAWRCVCLSICRSSGWLVSAMTDTCPSPSTLPAVCYCQLSMTRRVRSALWPMKQVDVCLTCRIFMSHNVTKSKTKHKILDEL